MKSDETGMADLLNVTQVAAKLGVCVRQVWKLTAAGKFPKPLRISRSVRWRRSDIDSYVCVGCDILEYERIRRQA